MPDISSIAHTGEPRKHLKMTQHLKMVKNCYTNKNISLWKITAYSSYQRPFVSTNSISFSARKKKSQIKATSHIPVETQELYYNRFLQTTAISHSKNTFNN